MPDHYSALGRLVQASKDQAYPSLQGLLHPASAAGLLGALSACLQGKDSKLQDRFTTSGMLPADRDALRSFLLQVSLLLSMRQASMHVLQKRPYSRRIGKMHTLMTWTNGFTISIVPAPL